MAESNSLEDDALAREVDKLLQKLPGADPYLKGEPEARPAAGGVVLGEAPSAVLARRKAAGPRAASRAQVIAVWARVVLGLLLGVLMTQWPYGRACGAGLGVYVASVVCVMIAGLWASTWSWRYMLPRAHVAALALILWGGVLLSAEVLPRTGYAALAATWSCRTGR